MSYFDDASLVMIPSGYKTSKVYSVKPTDGSGDLTFSRSNDTASRVNSAGLIEKVRTNRVLYSELQTDGLYSGTNIASVTAASNPLTGQNNAFKITSTTGNDPYFLQNVSGLSNGENTFSCWAWTDAGQSTEATLFFYNQTATEVYTKAITLTTTPTRYDHTVNFSNIGSIATVRIDLRQTGPTVQYVYTYGWQAESGVATSYIATTSAAVSVGPVANVPRLDYLNSTCPKLILEGQRTNLALNSETITAGTGTTVSLNNAASPDGYVNADKLVENTSTGVHQTFFATSLGGSVDSSAYCISIFAKAAGRSRIFFYDNNQNTSGVTTFDLSSGTIVSGGGKIENYGNGWYRCTIFPIKNFSTTSSAFIQLISTGTTTSYTGDGTSGALLWGRQVEAGAYATSYIPTLGAAVTRGADECSKTGISSLIGQTEGTIYLEADIQKYNESGFYVAISAGAVLASSIYLFQPSSGSLQVLIRNTGNPDGSIAINSANWTAGFNKVAIAYTATTAEVFINGVSKGSTSFVSLPALSQLTLGARPDILGSLVGAGPYSQALLFKTRLTNAQLAELTTL